jgi:hypothetical protein
MSSRSRNRMKAQANLSDIRTRLARHNRAVTAYALNLLHLLNELRDLTIDAAQMSFFE